MKPGKTDQIFLMTLGGMLVSILIGFIFFSTSIFSPTQSNFQFVAYGFMGALFFSLLEYKSLKEQVWGIILILFLNLIMFTGRSLSITYLIRDVFFIGSLILSVKLYYQFIKKNPQIKFYLRSFALALIYGLINTACGIIVYMVNAKAGFPPMEFIYIMARYGILIGLGIGLGTDFYFQNKKQLTGWLGIKTA
ncbi:MAG: hypothetical protein COW85_01270 [Ignavibacteria bacterium CG22_combo_CG10-13_8_21_14_all_37_15]|nr:MAG: hypothetical protein COW85_01270 [Ignavibacteria bacterium CG22_combo_CG10-13_8_21_14_all_37_15]